MTGQERSDNATEVENQLGNVAPGLYGACETCQNAYGIAPQEFYNRVHETQDNIIQDEGSFSWHACELCGSHLGGDRFAAHATKQENGKWEHTHLDVCSDCLMAMANGEPYPSEKEVS